MSTISTSQEITSASASTAAAGSSTTLATSTRSASTTAADAASLSASLSTFSSPSATTVALTTTFTPPSSCTEHRLSLLSSPYYNLWLNEPSPVPGSLVTDCYPTEFINGYTSLFNQTSSIAPLFSPLVCPDNWSAVNTYSSNYIACCPSGFELHPPSTTVDSNRPAYGGTCYTTFTVGQSMTVRAYDNTTLTATQPWTASSTADQAYAHVIEGFALAQASTSTTAPAAATTTSASPSSSSNSLSGGAIAGIVIGVVAFIALLVGLALFYFRRRRAAAAGNAKRSPSHEVDGTDVFHEKTGDTQFRGELSGVGAPKVELDAEGNAKVVHELDTGAQPAELDGGWKGSEVHSPGTVKEAERRREEEGVVGQGVERGEQQEEEGTRKVAGSPGSPPAY